MTQTEHVVLYFWNAECSVCGPLYDKLKILIQEHFPKLDIERIDIAKHPDLRQKYGVFTSPLIIVLFDGKEYFRSGGNISIHEFQDKVERLYQLRFEK